LPEEQRQGQTRKFIFQNLLFADASGVHGCKALRFFWRCERVSQGFLVIRQKQIAERIQSGVWVCVPM
jgi:hypothetical protein